MATSSDAAPAAQFFITFRKAEHLDGKHVVFGKVVEGMKVVLEVEQQTTIDNDRPAEPVIISRCGEMERIQIEVEETESEDEEGQSLELVVDDNPDIYPPARTFGRKLGALTHAFDRRGLQALYEEEQRLITGLSDIVERHFQQLEKGVTGQHARRLRRATNRVNSSLLKASKKLLVDFREQVVPRQESTLEHRMRELLEPDELVQAGVRLTVSRELAAFGPAPDDDGGGALYDDEQGETWTIRQGSCWRFDRDVSKYDSTYDEHL